MENQQPDPDAAVSPMETTIPSTLSFDMKQCEFCSVIGTPSYVRFDKRVMKNLCSACSSGVTTAMDKQKKLQDFKNNPEKYLARAGVPGHYLTKSFENYSNKESVARILPFTREQPPVTSLLFIGSCGSGKTHLAVAFIRELMMMGSLSDAIKFVNVPELLLELRSTFRDHKYEQNYPSEEQILRKYSSAGFLVLDDLGAEKSSEWAITSLYILIDRRCRNNLPFLVTTNLALESIEEKLGAPIASRLSIAKVVKVTGPDYRKLRPNQF